MLHNYSTPKSKKFLHFKHNPFHEPCPPPTRPTKLAFLLASTNHPFAMIMTWDASTQMHVRGRSRDSKYCDCATAALSGLSLAGIKTVYLLEYKILSNPKISTLCSQIQRDINQYTKVAATSPSYPSPRGICLRNPYWRKSNLVNTLMRTKVAGNWFLLYLYWFLILKWIKYDSDTLLVFFKVPDSYPSF